MPFRHVVMFRWAEHVDADHVARVSEGFDTLPGEIDVISAYRHGPDAGISGGNFDYVVVADFDDADGFRTYRDHPVHVQFVVDLIKGNVVDRSAVQFVTD